MANAVRFSRISGDSSRFLDDSLQIPVPISLQFQDDPPPQKKTFSGILRNFLTILGNFPKNPAGFPQNPLPPPNESPTPSR